ncbi:MAG: prolyl oligopeptidase family serine peptidase [Saprospiraceae bacterium]|nr:prolyl oligopeptidase family serine peptidase [Saprospiraceae bacterium]
MQRLITLFIFLTGLSNMSAQEISGKWNGMLKIQGIQLRIVMNITKTDTGYVSTMDSPDQGAKGIPVTETTFENSVLKFSITMAGINFEGKMLNDSLISGNFRQANFDLPLDFTRTVLEKPEIKRPQNPEKPYPYYEEELTFDNKKAGITLAGTLTLPDKDGRYPAVILITGSGPQNRDEELLGHKPFLVLADFLTKNGIAVLRFDDRGTAESKGDFNTATSADFATDVQAAVNYLKTRPEIINEKIGLMGHSEGGIIAPMVAANSGDIAFIVMLAGTGIRGDKLLLLQQELIGRASGISEKDLKTAEKINRKIFKAILKSKDSEKLKTDLTNYMKQAVKENPEMEIPQGMTVDELIKTQVTQVTSPWMQYFIKYDPVTSLKKVKCPVLAVNGEKDLQVPPKENLEPIKNALLKSGNKNVTTIEFRGLNHLFQECTTGSPSEYGTIEQTFAPVALEEILKWIQKQVK